MSESDLETDGRAERRFSVLSAIEWTIFRILTCNIIFDGLGASQMRRNVQIGGFLRFFLFFVPFAEAFSQLTTPFLVNLVILVPIDLVPSDEVEVAVV